MISQEFTPPHPTPPTSPTRIQLWFHSKYHLQKCTAQIFHKSLKFFFLKKKYTDLYTKPKGVKDGHIFLDRWNDSWIRKVHYQGTVSNLVIHQPIHKYIKSDGKKKQQNLHCIKLKYFWFVHVFAHRAMLMFVKILYPCIKLFLQGLFA